jgi:hypothetical protein
MAKNTSGIRGHMLVMKFHQDTMLCLFLVVIMLNIKDIKILQGIIISVSKPLIVTYRQQEPIQMI